MIVKTMLGRHSILKKLSLFVIESVVTYPNKCNGRIVCRPEKELNEISREDMAKSFFYSTLTVNERKSFSEVIGNSNAIQKLAIKIDRMIPKAYVKVNYLLKTPLESIDTSNYHHDLFFHYRDNQVTL